MNSRAMWNAAAIAGVAMALLSSIPVISLGNCLLCGWMWGGGMLSVYLYRRSATDAIVTTGQGATLGALAGVIGGVIGAILGAALTAIGGGFTAGLAQAAQQLQATNPEAAQALQQFAGSGSAGVAGFLASLILGTIFYVLFGAIGGAIGASLFKGRTTTM